MLRAAEGSVHEYRNAQLSPKGNAYMLYGGSEGLYATSANAQGSGVANGKSYIRFDSSLIFRRPADSVKNLNPADGNTGLVEAIIFEVADMDKIGGRVHDQRAFCCSADLSKEIGCPENEVIKRSSQEDPDWPQAHRVYFKGTDLEASFLFTDVNITRTGMYTLYFITCDSRLSGLVVSGKTVWKNPYGYLPGRMAPLMTFYGFLSLCYLILGLLWLLQYLRFWKDILQLQNCITLVIALGMVEMAMWYFEYVNFNRTGLRPMGITIWAVTLGAVKKTVSRLLILVVSMGYGVVRPTLGGLTSKVLLLGGTYFLAAESLDVVENVGTINDLSGKARLFLVLPVAILDAFFILWIFTSLSKTLEKLQARKQVAKLDLYRKFTNALAVAVVVAVVWIGYELYFKATDSYSEGWQNAWIISAFWSILTFLLLCVVCALWTPSQNSTRYAYSEDVGEDFEDEAAIALTAPNGGSKAAPDAEKAPVKERKPVNTDVFSLDDDVEEDKRE
ncbi:hypothetical protein R1sor_002664 [Riccia sorocarpa]|uniref:GOST seven transmembrane domain-containing protein n=1 Tax=Riccia sorocarpa TaxID=122646 RepID=A0ABD3H225_9MARC